MVEDNQPGHSPITPEWLTVEQAAEWLQVSTKTIRRYIEAGNLPAVNLGGRAIRIRRQDLESWLQSRRVEPGVSLRQQERLERRRRHSRGGRTPRYPTAEELDEVDVTIAQEQPLVLRCNSCATTWTPEVRSNGKLARGAWRCPNGCNSEYHPG
jgi:excisionase family DNA binding protein